MVNYDTEKGVSVLTRTQPGSGKTQSRLTVRSAGAGDSGNYTCKPSKIAPATIQVFVSQERGEVFLLIKKVNNLFRAGADFIMLLQKCSF